eukprot:g2987.t1
MASSADKGALLANQAGEKLDAFAAAKFGGLWKFLFFIGAAYLLLFGVVMLIIDAPMDTHGLSELRFAIFRYLLFMTRFVGRGVWYLFLATMIWASLYNLGLDPVLGFVLTGIVGALGIISIYFGMTKSLRLEKMRKALCALGPAAVLDLCPARGLTLPEFNDLAKKHVSGMSFSAEELGYIAAALSFKVRSDDMISMEEFRAWTQGSMTIL